jgi:IS5 family transposase
MMPKSSIDNAIFTIKDPILQHVLTFLAHELTTANIYDSEAVPDLLNQLTKFKIGFALGDKAYDSKLIREQAKERDILFLTPLNKRKGGKRKESFARVMPAFLKRALFRCRSEIERVFSFLKNKQGVEQPRWYGKNRYHFHCQMCVLIHNIRFLF